MKDEPQIGRRIGGGVQKHNPSILHGVPGALILCGISFNLENALGFRLFYNDGAVGVFVGRIASALVVRVRLSLGNLVGLTHGLVAEKIES